MSNLSKGVLRARPMTISMNASLTDIRDALIADKPVLSKMHRGWGSIYEDAAVIGDLNTQPAGNDPVIIPGVPGRRPDILAARLYWYTKDTALVRVLGVSASPQSTHRLRATDVLISETTTPGGFLLLVTTHAGPDIDTLTVPALQNALTPVDRAVTINMATSSVDFGDVDFFLWLICRKFAKVAPSAVVEINDIYQVMVQDALDQQTSIARGVNQGRVELVTLLASSTSSFGPAWMSMTCPSMHAACNFHVSVNGAVDVEVPSIHYSDGIPATGLEKRFNILTDLVHTVLPSLKDAYANDKAWVTSGRTSFRAQMKAEALAGVNKL